MPLLVMSGTEEGGEGGSEELAEREEEEEEKVSVPAVDIPEMMSDEVSNRWV